MPTITTVDHRPRQDLQHPWAAGVCVSQVLFLTIGYTHQLAFDEVNLEKIHVSGMLDNETRSLLCGLVAIISGCALVAGELTRPVAFLPLRILLAASCGIGILLVCLVRESRSRLLHVVFACLAFGAGIALIWVVLYTTNYVYRGWARFPATILLVVCVVTGVAQGLNIAKLWKLPTHWLAIAEAIMILLFGYSILKVSGEQIYTSSSEYTVREVCLSPPVVPLERRLVCRIISPHCLLRLQYAISYGDRSKKRKRYFRSRLLRRAPLWLCLLRCSSWLHTTIPTCSGSVVAAGATDMCSSIVS